MVNRRYFMLGYIAQLSSVLSLAAANLLLPLLIGTVPFYEVSVVNGLAMLAAGPGSNVVAFSLVRRLAGTSDATQRGGAIVDAIWLYLLSAFAILVPVAGIFLVRTGHVVYVAAAIVTTLLMGVYTIGVFALSALHRSGSVAMLTVVNGTMCLLVPLVGFHAELPLALAPALVNVISLLALIGGWQHEHVKLSGQRWLPEVGWLRRAVKLFPLAAPNLVRLTNVWAPVLYLGAIGRVAEAVAYRMVSSVVEGLTATVPQPSTAVLAAYSPSTGEGSRNRMLWQVGVAGAALLVIAVTAASSVLSPLLAQFKGIRLGRPFDVMSIIVVLNVLLALITHQFVMRSRDATLGLTSVSAIAAGLLGMWATHDALLAPIIALATFVLGAALLLRSELSAIAGGSMLSLAVCVSYYLTINTAPAVHRGWLALGAAAIIGWRHFAGFRSLLSRKPLSF